MKTPHVRSGLIPLSVCAVLTLAACGSDESVSSPTDPTLLAPVAVNVVGSGGDSAGDGALGSSRSETAVATDFDMSTGLMPAFGGYVFEVGVGLPALPTDSTGYHYPAGVGVDATEVARIADALGIAGNPEAASAGSGNQWRVGPEDGSAPALFVSNDGQVSWYYSNAWAAVEVAGCGVSGSAGAPTDVASSIPLEATAATVEADIDVGVGADGQVPTSAVEPGQRPAIEECPTPEPPEGVPTADEAAARANELLTALGEEPAAFEFETFADEWSASVTALPIVDGVRLPIGFGFGFEGQGALQWANGTLAEPVATGPYPLVDLETAISRLGEQNGMWGYGGGRDVLAVDARAAEAAAATSETKPGEPVVDDGQTSPAPPDDGSTPPIPEPTPIPEPVVVTLVDVEADLWWVWDADNTVWLLPAYKFTDTEGTEFMVPAVTDEFMIVVEPTITSQPESLPPESVPAERLDPAVVDPPSTGVEFDPAAGLPPAVREALAEFIGLPVEKFDAAVSGFGYTTRVARQDGVDLAITADYSETRLNLAVEEDIVVEIISLG